MGNKNTKSSLRNAIIYLNISADEISADDDEFWSQIFSEDMCVADDVIKNITVQEIRMLRDGAPKNFATLAFKIVERLCLATGSLCNTQSQQTAVLNSVRILLRMVPCIFEDRLWRYFLRDNDIDLDDHKVPIKSPVLKYPQKQQSERNYAAYVPMKPGSQSITPIHHPQYREESPKTTTTTTKQETASPTDAVGDLLLQSDQIFTSTKIEESKFATEKNSRSNDKSLMKALILSICDLLFCPEFTVLPHGDSYLANAVDAPPEDLKSLSTYDYVWEPGVGFDSSVNSTTYYDKNRAELLRAILVCLSATLYETPDASIDTQNEWIELFVSQDNRHTLPLFTSLLNVVLGYSPPRTLLPLNNFLFDSGRERLVELSSQLLMAALDYKQDYDEENDKVVESKISSNRQKNLFIEYMSRIHREEDLQFLLRGFIRLMNSGLDGQGYLWSSSRYIEVNQELQMLLWKMCNLNKKFLQYLLASNDLLEIVVPILYHLNENFQETSRTALIHIGVFNLLVLSGERNFGVRLNKPYTGNHLLTNLPEINGTHADLMIIVFHKLIMYGYKINQLYDYLLTVLVNVSPYLKGTTILACKCMIQLFETFSSVLVVFTEPNYHQLVISLLEIFNNLIQYQFDGNANLVYMILQKKEIFINLANMSTSQKSIDKVIRKLIRRKRCIEQLNEASTERESCIGDASNQVANEKNADARRDVGNIDDHADDNDNDDENLDLSLAIVSCTKNILSIGSSSARRQEVSLVATPDLQHTTRPIHPFGSDNDIASTSQSQHGSEDAMPNNHHFGTAQTAKSCVLDDILIDAEDHEEEAAPAANMNSAMRQEQISGNDEVNLLCDHVESASGLAKLAVGDSIISPDCCVEQEDNHCKRWRPTSDWLKTWKRTLPLETILRMICALEPQVDQFKRAGGKCADEAEIIKFLQNGTLVGLLPVPHPIQIRKYRTNDRSTMWFRAYSWGIIYVRNSFWIGTDIKLIKIL